MKQFTLTVLAFGLLAMMGLTATPVSSYDADALGGCEDLGGCIEGCEEFFDELVDWCLDHPG